MAYTRFFQNALFEGPLLQQVIAVIQRDQAEALAIVNARRAAMGNAALAPINEFHLGPGMRTAMPWLSIGIDEGQEDEDAPLVSASEARFSLTLDVGQFDQEMAQMDAADYARMLRTIILSANLQPQNAGPGDAWTTALPIAHETCPLGTTAPNEQCSVKEVFTLTHRYGLAQLQDIEAPVLRVTLGLKFVLIED